ncbi:hypothetical protein CKAN_00869200 [Cinnamomum micranthum f. kanehirae]|uniref:Uncharacterized protein n=1 Tax=Cinnamomum micranthum f. kanehirae TaxID=337451 RepID=A0A3S3MAN7_9MAGN|nr:hypothetical protein CKAN_00869200 [Cinnamomum micranthum f. kanehirae]
MVLSLLRLNIRSPSDWVLDPSECILFDSIGDLYNGKDWAFLMKYLRSDCGGWTRGCSLMAEHLVCVSCQGCK